MKIFKINNQIWILWLKETTIHQFKAIDFDIEEQKSWKILAWNLGLLEFDSISKLNSRLKKHWIARQLIIDSIKNQKIWKIKIQKMAVQKSKRSFFPIFQNRSIKSNPNLHTFQFQNDDHFKSAKVCNLKHYFWKDCLNAIESDFVYWNWIIVHQHHHQPIQQK